MNVVRQHLQQLYRTHWRTQRILSCAANVYRSMSAGVSERIYQNAMKIELREAKLQFEEEVTIVCQHRNEFVGTLRCDLMVEKEVVIEHKCLAGGLKEEHVLQLQNYLNALKLPLGVLLNFGKRRVDVVQVVMMAQWPTILNMLPGGQFDDKVAVSQEVTKYADSRPNKLEWVCVDLNLPVETSPESKLLVLAGKTAAKQ